MNKKCVHMHCGLILEAVERLESREANLWIGLRSLDAMESEIIRVIAAATREQRSQNPEDGESIRKAMHRQFMPLRHAINELRLSLEREESTYEERLTSRIFATYLLDHLSAVLDLWDPIQITDDSGNDNVA